MSPRRWKKVRSSLEKDHTIFRVRKDVCVSPRTGAEHEFTVLESRDWVVVVALTAAGEVVLIRQYRHGYGAVTLEFPGGLVEDGVKPEQAARDELRQETGYGGGVWTELGRLSAVPALFDNHLHVFLARGVERRGEPELDAGEDIHTELVPKGRLRGLVEAGEIIHAQMLAALYLYELWAERQGGRGGG